MNLNLSDHEKRTIKRAGLALGIFLLIYGSMTTFRFIQERGSRYRELSEELASLDTDTLWIKVKKLKEDREAWPIDSAKLEDPQLRLTLRETIEKTAEKHELSVATQERRGQKRPSFNVVGTAKLENLLNFVHALRGLGYPLVIQKYSATAEEWDPRRVKLSLTIEYVAPPAKKESS